MKFAPVALLALAAGVQAGNGFKQAEPAPNEKAVHNSAATGAMTGTMPLRTGTHGRNSTVAVTSTASCHKCTSTPVAPTSTPGSGSGGAGGAGGGSGGGSGSGSGSGAGNTPASPSSTGFSPSPNPGAKITVPMAGAALGSVAYGLMFLA